MAVQGLERMRTLASHHLPAMDLSHKRVLVLRNDGKPDREAAAIEGISEGTVKLRMSVASAEISLCLPVSARLTGEMRGAWVQAHLECCLGDAVAELTEAGA